MKTVYTPALLLYYPDMSSKDSTPLPLSEPPALSPVRYDLSLPSKSVEADGTPEVTAILDQAFAGQVDQAALVRYAPEAKVKAYEMFLTTEHDPETIALSIGVPVFLVQHWVSVEKWGDRKAQFQMQIYKKVEVEHQRFVLDHRLVTAQRHLSVAKALEEEIEWILKEIAKDREANPNLSLKGRDMTLLRLSNALKAATDVSARVVGLTDQLRMEGNNGSSTIILMGGRPASPSKGPRPVMATVSPSPVGT